LSSRKVFTNAELSAALQWLIDRWGVLPGAVLRLFRNDLEPTPASVAVDFVEANFPGYSPVLLAGEMTGPIKAADGHYESLTNQYTFFPPASGSGNVIFGGYVTLDGVAVAADRFPEPIPMTIGSPPFRLRMRVSTKSESLFELDS